MSLTTPDSIRSLQKKLYCKAKADSAYRFSLLYDKIHREDILAHAYALARANGGAPGVDGVTFAMLEAAGLKEWFTEIRNDLVTKTYRPAPVRRGGVSKPGGGGRAAARHPDDPGPGGANRGQAGAGADLRGGPRSRGPWLSAWAERGRCDQGGARDGLPGLHRCGGRRSVEVLRHDPASGVDAVGGAAGRRPACPAADQAVAQSAGRGTRCGWEAAYVGREEQPAGHATRWRDQPDARQPVHEPVPEALATHWKGRSLSGPRRLLCGRLRHPQSRLCGRGTGVDASSDDPARACPQREEDRDPGCPERALRLPWLQLRPAPLQEGRPLVPRGEPIEEERAAAQSQGERHPDPRQHGCLAWCA